MSCDVLLVAAFAPELAPLREVLGDAMRARVGNRDVAARAVGIGLPMAAAGAAVQIAEMQPGAVVFLGTCGAYADARPALATPASSAPLAIADVVAARHVRLVDPAAVDGAAQFPDPMSVTTEADGSISAALVRAGARAADGATTLASTVGDAVAARVARATGTQAEHLEAHGVATACAARGIPFGAALGVANFVGARAREEWRAHHRQAAAAAAEVVLRWLRHGV